MKKILLTLLLALPFCMVAKAQDFRVGITGGYNLSSPSGYKSQSGFHVGVKGELGLPIVTKGLYMDFGLMLSSHGWKSPGYYYDGNYNPSAGIITDVPYGNLVEWEQGKNSMDAMLEQLWRISHENTILAVCMDKKQKINCEKWERLEKQNIGKRKFEIYKK